MILKRGGKEGGGFLMDEGVKGICLLPCTTYNKLETIQRVLLCKGKLAPI